MPSSRLEAFSDGVLAIVITIMVLELRTPEGHELSDLLHSTGIPLLTYVLSFLYVGIYWNNHHHLFQAAEKVNGAVLWSNLHLLFWLSLLPFTTGWMDDSGLSRAPVLVYGVNLVAAAVAYLILQRAIVSLHGPGSRVESAIGADLKGKTSFVTYVVGILAAVAAGRVLPDRVGVGLALACFTLVAALWLIPDRRLEASV